MESDNKRLNYTAEEQSPGMEETLILVGMRWEKRSKRVDGIGFEGLQEANKFPITVSLLCLVPQHWVMSRIKAAVDCYSMEHRKIDQSLKLESAMLPCLNKRSFH